MKFKLKRSGTFYLKFTPQPHWESFAKVEYNGVNSVYSVQYLVIPTFIQYFFLWFILEVRVDVKKDGYGTDLMKQHTMPSKEKSQFCQ